MAVPVTLVDKANAPIQNGNPLAVTGSVSGEVTIAAIGTTADAAWNGTAPNATVIALLKAIAINTSTT